MSDLLGQLDGLNASQLCRLLVEHLTRQKLGLYWEASAIERDRALNADVVLPRMVAAWSCAPSSPALPPEGEGSQPPHLLGEGRAARDLADVVGRPSRLAGSSVREGAFAHRKLILEGDNFDALRLLRASHRGKIRVIYIDPPYNTGNKDWVYNDRYVGANDRWRHSQWLEFLYRRLTLARDLLTPDGVILVSINDENRARLELLMDEVFPGRRLGTLTWRTRQGSNDASSYFLSVDHEHVLVYGNTGFSFNGFSKSYEMYGNPDDDPRGDWRPDNFTCPKDFKERPNLYYPLLDPKTAIAYPPNPDRVWVYASANRLQEGQTVEVKTMEEFIDLGQILFPSEQRVETWPTLEALLAAIDAGEVPRSGKTPLLRRDLPNLEFWVGRPIGFGRPQFKRYKADLRNQTQPLSSWVVPSFEEGSYYAEASFVSSTNQEGARMVAEIFGDRAFNYAKPLSLIKNLLRQATRPGDTILDFFAGSGTTGQAVLELNAEDGGQRKFILCSSTEATKKEPDKNLCRDVCAERMRRVIAGYGGKPGFGLEQGGEFAYLQLDNVDAADAHVEIDLDHAFQLLALKRLGAALPVPAGEIKRLGRATLVPPVIVEYSRQPSLFDALPADEPGGVYALDEMLPDPPSATPRPRRALPASREELLDLLTEKNIRAYPRRLTGVRNLPTALKRERRPEMDDMSAVSGAVATRLPIPDELKKNAVRAALNRLKEKEVHTELTRGVRHEEDVQVITDRAAMVREAIAILRNLPQVEDEDVRIIVGLLGRRLRAAIDEAFENVDADDRPSEAELNRHARDAAHWVIRREAGNLAELMQGIVAEFTTLEDAEPFPDLMLFPAALSLTASRKNIYGVMPPSEDDLAAIDSTLLLEERAWLADRRLTLGDAEIRLGRFDGTAKLNGEERDFAQALDRADFVEWWHRNPDLKPHAVKLVRGDHQHYFYPDFVVCLSHIPGDEPIARLVETKENVKDAARKARRVPRSYGKVLFLTRDQSRLRVINDDGSLGSAVDSDDLTAVREWLRGTRPMLESKSDQQVTG